MMPDPADQLLVFCLGRTVCRPTLSYPIVGFITIHFPQCLEVMSTSIIRIECLDWPLSEQFQKEHPFLPSGAANRRLAQLPQK
jgi:hypothetical protein